MTVRIPPGHPALAPRGWCDTRDPSATRLVWSGTGFSTRLEGGPVRVLLEGRGMVEIRLDGRTIRTLGPDLQPFDLESRPGVLVRELVVEKLTEPVAGIVAFLGLEVGEDVRLSAPEPPPGPSLLFLGDSLTCGYGILARSPSEGFSPETETVRLSFAGIAAEALRSWAQYSAWSGKGLQENFDRTRVAALPHLWKLADPFDGTSSIDAPARPDIALVNLGTNDVFHADPQWPDFVRAAIEFGDDLRSVFPAIPILFLDGPALTDAALRDHAGSTRPVLSRSREALDRAASALAESGPTWRFSLSSCRPDEPHGADHHPGRERHRLAGLELAGFVQGLSLPIGLPRA